MNFSSVLLIYKDAKLVVASDALHPGFFASPWKFKEYVTVWVKKVDS